jgi:metallo-beta-lactamase family protein
MQPGLRVTFWGAAGTVTGSMHLVEAGRHSLLLDCGLFQGHRAEARQRNSHFPFDARRIDAVVLSHAHLDHCGSLPTLVRQGFSGPIYCTPATRDLLAVMLVDSAKIQEEDALFLNRHRPAGERPVEPLYERRDAHRTLRQVVSIPYDHPQETRLGMEIRFLDAGHLLGSAIVVLRVETSAGEKRLTFTGDLGRPGLPILRDPAPVPPAPLLLSESTYGDRIHPPVTELAESLGQLVRRTVERGGRVLIPAFSLGRTQLLVYYLHQLIQGGQLPEVPIFVDSPLGTAATEVFRLHPECFDEETIRLLEDDPDLFGRKRVHYVESVEESKQLNGLKEPCVILASSGMCEAGRILHHLKQGIGDSRNTVLLVGFQAPDTLGRRLAERRPEVRILGGVYPVRAEVEVLHGMSAHADRGELLTQLGPLAGQVDRVRLVHGDRDQAESLAQALRAQGFKDVGVPERGDTVTLP